MVVVPSTKSFEETYNDLVTLLNDNPNIRILAEIDHAGAAAGVGLELEPTKLVVFGNPALGSPVMAHCQAAGLDLPQKMLVWQESGGSVYVGYNSIQYLVSRYPDIVGAPQLDIKGGALTNLAGGATGVSLQEVQEQAVMTPQELNSLRRQHTLRHARSEFDFDTTLSRLKAAIEESPAKVVLEVDHAANAAAGPQIQLLPTTLLVFGNPNLGTPLLQAGQSAGIDLPLKMLVWQKPNGNVMVTTNAPYFLRERHDLEGVGTEIAMIRAATFNFLAAATSDM